jgi:DNA-directed RNA polymerase specialized sigma24 family protein
VELKTICLPSGELRFFGGLSVDEIAEVLHVSPITVQRDWQFARAWLEREIS